MSSYAENFNKDLNADEIKFFGKIHFKRDRSENKLNMHCHLIVSRKDQSNKKKLSPLTNHRNTKKGAIKGGFDRKTLFQQAETGFDKLFGYNRQLSETFEYCNTMKNGTVSEKLQMQERELNMPKIPLAEEIISNKIPQNQNSSVGAFEHTNIPTFDQPTNHSINQSGLSSLFSILSSDSDNGYIMDEPQQLMPKKKKKKQKPRLS